MAAVLEAAGIAVKLVPTTGPGTARDLARTAVHQGDDLVLVCGGDGTVNEVINGLALSNVTLGILPGGTANIIAKELCLPHNPVRAARELPRWSPRRIALGLATWQTGVPNSAAENKQRYFLSVAGVGFDAHIIYRLSASFKMSWGVVAYVLEVLRQAFRYSFPPFLCQIEDGERRATFVGIHRTRRYAGWLHLAPAANLFEPRFTSCLFKSRHRARYFLYAAAVLLRQHPRLTDVEMIDGRKVTCRSEQPGTRIHVELDGELAGELPATFEIVPDALTLLVP